MVKIIPKSALKMIEKKIFHAILNTTTQYIHVIYKYMINYEYEFFFFSEKFKMKIKNQNQEITM